MKCNLRDRESKREREREIERERERNRERVREREGERCLAADKKCTLRPSKPNIIFQRIINMQKKN